MNLHWSRTTSFLAAVTAFSAVTLHAQLAPASPNYWDGSVPGTTAQKTDTSIPAVEPVQAVPVQTTVQPVPGVPEPVEMGPPSDVPQKSHMIDAVIHLLSAMEAEYMAMGHDQKAEQMRQMMRAIHGINTADMPHEYQELSHEAAQERQEVPMRPTHAISDMVQNAKHMMSMADAVVLTASEMNIDLSAEVIEPYNQASKAYDSAMNNCADASAASCKEALKITFDSIRVMERSILTQAEADPVIYVIVDTAKRRIADTADIMHTAEPEL